MNNHELDNRRLGRITFALVQGFGDVSIIQYTCESHFVLQE